MKYILSNRFCLSPLELFFQHFYLFLHTDLVLSHNIWTHVVAVVVVHYEWCSEKTKLKSRLKQQQKKEEKRLTKCEQHHTGKLNNNLRSVKFAFYIHLFCSITLVIYKVIDRRTDGHTDCNLNIQICFSWTNRSQKKCLIFLVLSLRNRYWFMTGGYLVWLWSFIEVGRGQNNSHICTFSTF